MQTLEKKNMDALNILLIDDDIDYRSVLRRLMVRGQESNYRFSEATDGITALQMCVENPPDCILLDYHLPNSNGLDFLKNLRGDATEMPLPVIMLTGQGNEKIAVEAMKLGAQDYLIKGEITPAEMQRTIEHALEKFSLHQQLQQQEKELRKAYVLMQEEMEQARQTQQALLPKTLPQSPHVDIGYKFEPMTQIGGDFYDVLEVEENMLGFVVGDVTGHSIPAALLSFMLFGIFRDSARGLPSPSLVVNLVNGRMEGHLPDNKFASLIYGIFDTINRTFTYVSAGHPPALLLRSSTQEVIQLSSRGMLLGFLSSISDYQERSISLNPGDKVLLYSDAIYEVMSPEGRVLGLHRLQNFLIKNSHLPISELIEAAYQYALDYSGTAQFDDDFTLLGFEVKAPTDE